MKLIDELVAWRCRRGPTSSKTAAGEAPHAAFLDPHATRVRFVTPPTASQRYNVYNTIALSIPVTTLLGVPLAWRGYFPSQSCSVRWIYSDWANGLKLNLKLNKTRRT